MGEPDHSCLVANGWRIAVERSAFPALLLGKRHRRTKTKDDIRSGTKTDEMAGRQGFREIVWRLLTGGRYLLRTLSDSAT